MKSGKFGATLELPGDKSFSHRALMLAALTDGECRLENSGTGADIRSTIHCLQKCGVDIIQDEATGTWTIRSRGLMSPNGPLDCGNSGTSARLLMGFLAGQGVTATFTGDDSLRKRPMDRVTNPLKEMGAKITDENGHLPVEIDKADLHEISYRLPVPSAQVKSAILLAGLGAEGTTTIVEPVLTRDHTERMMSVLGVDLTRQENRITLQPMESPLNPFEIRCPGDPSSAAFFAGMAAICPHSFLTFKHLMLNPTRIEFFQVLKRMGVQVAMNVENNVLGEPVGVMTIVSPESLLPIQISRADIPIVIDEIPILTVVASQAQGISRFEGLDELRVKETDRVQAIVGNLEQLGGNVQIENEDTLVVRGPTPLHGGDVITYGDHRIAMAFATVKYLTDESVNIHESECVSVSFPEFFQIMNSLPCGGTS